MALFFYKALTDEGKIVRDKAYCKSADEVLEIIEERGQTAIKITRSITSPTRKLGAKRLSTQARQLGFIYSSGTSVKDLSKIFKDFAHAPKNAQLAEDVFESELLKGRSLSEALGERYPDFFLEMVKVGEKSGALLAVFDKLTSYYENQNKRETQIYTALIYPVITFVFVAFAFSNVCLFLAPAYISVYASMRISPPTFLRFLANFFDNAPVYFLGAGALFGIVIYLIYSFKDWIELKIPMYKKEFNRRFAFAFSILYESGVHIQEALRLVKGLTKNKIVAKDFELINRRVAEGMSLSAALSDVKIFEPIVTELIITGESSGFLSEALAACAAYLEADAESANAAVAKLVEPVMTLILGAIVFGVMAAVMAPAILISSQMF
jgi:type II secretory pathway component PulF